MCRKRIEKQETKYINKTDGKFTAKAVATLNADQVKLPATFQCEISIPLANYTSYQEYVYNGKYTNFDIKLFIKINFLIMINCYVNK